MEFKIKERVLRQLNIKLPNGDCVQKNYGEGIATSVCRYGGKLFEAPAGTTVYLRAIISRNILDHYHEYVVLWFISNTEFSVFINEIDAFTSDPFKKVETENEFSDLVLFIAEHKLDRLDNTTEVPYVIEEDPLRFHR